MIDAPKMLLPRPTRLGNASITAEPLTDHCKEVRITLRRDQQLFQ